mmetsp:Transcript_33804/g.50121  ORF Transcript_33804/g.50121 Transcript_33804/m.50121 type:complete len:157 (-) Transcript_33804:774-1244(-)
MLNDEFGFFPSLSVRTTVHPASWLCSTHMIENLSNPISTFEAPTFHAPAFATEDVRGAFSLIERKLILILGKTEEACYAGALRTCYTTLTPLLTSTKATGAIISQLCRTDWFVFEGRRDRAVRTLQLTCRCFLQTEQKRNGRNHERIRHLLLYASG